MKMELPTDLEIRLAAAKDALRRSEAAYATAQAEFERAMELHPLNARIRPCAMSEAEHDALSVALKVNDMTVDECRALLGEAA